MRGWVVRVIVVGALAAFAACGGKVVIDQDEEGGLGGQGGASSGSSSVSGGFGCSWPSPNGAVVSCGGSAGAGAGMPFQCDEFYCDEQGNQYESSCQGSTCQCKYNNVQKCTCIQNQGWDFCTGKVAPCCPIPK